MVESDIDVSIKPSIPFLPFVDPAAVANAASSSSHEHDIDGLSNVVDEANAEIATNNATLEEHVSDDSNLFGRSPTGEKMFRRSPTGAKVRT